jgi:hypothetical protein
MARELAGPGAFCLALQGDQPSARSIGVAVEDGMQGGAIFEGRARHRSAKSPAEPRS